jgi:L-2,4-diaminobutyric acid acetyltransferase
MTGVLPCHDKGRDDSRGTSQASPSAEAEAGSVSLGVPVIGDGASMWELARDSGGLDLNSPYAYLIWCRDFAATSVAARSGGDLVGFITGYVRPEAPDTFVVWQVTVGPSQRGRGLAAKMLHHLADRLASAGVRFLEATVTPSNEPSARLFAGFARDRAAPVERATLFDGGDFPDEHEPEVLTRIGPLGSVPGNGHRSAPSGSASGPPQVLGAPDY